MADVNRDGSVDVTDLQHFVATFSLTCGDTGFDRRCDFNHDAGVDMVDLLIFVDNFGT